MAKSYKSTLDPQNPILKDLVLPQIFADTIANQRVSELVNLDTGEITTNLQLLDKVSIRISSIG